MVLHLRAPKGKVSVEVMLNRAKYFDRTGKVNDHTIYLSGNLGKNALEFAMCLSAKAKGGRVYTMGHTLVVEGADEAVLYFGADSTFRYASADVASWEPRVQDVWLCTHLWMHYSYTQDLEFLKWAYPVMAEAALFFVDFLEEKDGYLVTNPSLSPENVYILPNGEQGCCCMGATMDLEILRELFTGCKKAAEILGDAVDEAEIPDVSDMRKLQKEINAALEKLPPIRIDSTGRVMEWMEEYEEAEPGHRHVSQLYGLYPSDQISMDKTPELAAAAAETLRVRLANGGGHTGWSRAWIINFYAKLWDGEKAWENICQMLAKSTYANLFDRHPPFQIDGNFGVTAAIAQMLVQSREQEVILLPALPKAWEQGEVKGLRLVQNAGIALAWKDGRLVQCRVTADQAYEGEIVYGSVRRMVKLEAGETMVLDERLQEIEE